MRGVPWMCAAILAGCGTYSKDNAGGRESSPVLEAVAVVHPTEGNSCRGVVRFVETVQGVRVTARIEGLRPGGRHGFHIHEFGDCTAPDATSAGGHYNPEGHPHAGPSARRRHAGDLGNLEADQNGVAVYDAVISDVTIDGSRNPILGRSVIVHAQEDDLTTQPTGNAGARIGCGVIGVARPSR